MRELVRGKSNKEIAYELDLKMNTISTYKMRILKKMEVTSTLELSQKLWALSIE
jgi:two-component system, NarL family, invasion response regulator UvrY